MARVSVKSIRRIALVLGVLPILFITIIAWSGRFEFFGGNVLSVDAAWSRGLLQGFLVLNILLFVAAIGLWHLKRWASFVAFSWFPLLATNNILTELWLTQSVQPESWFQAIVISAIWLGCLHSFLIGGQAREIFLAGADT
jgi:hypothetical protein